MTGPNDSSIAMYMWSCTSVNSVGSKKNPEKTACYRPTWDQSAVSPHYQASVQITSPGRCTCLPPQTRVAPSLMPVWQYSTSLSRWALWFWGPWSVERSRGSPIFIFFISSTWEKRHPNIWKPSSLCHRHIQHQDNQHWRPPGMCALPTAFLQTGGWTAGSPVWSVCLYKLWNCLYCLNLAIKVWYSKSQDFYL